MTKKPPKSIPPDRTGSTVLRSLRGPEDLRPVFRGLPPPDVAWALYEWSSLRLGRMWSWEGLRLRSLGSLEKKVSFFFFFFSDVRRGGKSVFLVCLFVKYLKGAYFGNNRFHFALLFLRICKMFKSGSPRDLNTYLAGGKKS